MFTKALAVAALAALPALATSAPAVNVYFGQSGSETDRLRTYCDSTGFEYVTVGFVNKSPQQDASGLKYPGTNFAKHCITGAYKGPNGDSNLLAKCGLLAADLRYCQNQGKKVLLSIGGTWDPPTSDYTISSPPQGEEFANFIWGAFGPYKASWGTKPRPFDDSYGGADAGQEHFAFDGFDFDIEYKFSECCLLCYPPKRTLISLQMTKLAMSPWSTGSVTSPSRSRARSICSRLRPNARSLTSISR